MTIPRAHTKTVVTNNFIFFACNTSTHISYLILLELCEVVYKMHTISAPFLSIFIYSHTKHCHLVKISHSQKNVFYRPKLQDNRNRLAFYCSYLPLMDKIWNRLVVIYIFLHFIFLNLIHVNVNINLYINILLHELHNNFNEATNYN